MADETSMKPKRVLRPKEYLKRLGVTASVYNRGVRAGIYPKPFKLGPPPARAVGLLESTVDALIDQLATQAE